MRLDHLRSVNAPRLARAAALHALLPDATPRARAWIWSCIASHGLIALDVVSRLEAAKRAVDAWREQGDAMRLHFALGFLASESARARDFDTAARMLDEVRALEQPTWPVKRLMWGASVVAGVCIHLGDAQGYRDASRRELAFAERAGADRAAAWARLKLADAALMAGDIGEAIDLGRGRRRRAARPRPAVEHGPGPEQPVRRAAAGGRPRRRPRRSGGSAAAAVAQRLALPAARFARLPRGPRRPLPSSGARLLGFADAWYAAHGDERQPNEATLERRAAATIAAALGDDACAEARAAGRALGDADAQALAGAVVGCFNRPADNLSRRSAAPRF